MRQPGFLDQSLFTELASKAAANPRGRQHHNFHAMEEPCHRMAVGLQPSTYIPPHRHLSADKAECLIVLRGKLGLLIFDEQGVVVRAGRRARVSLGLLSTTPGCALNSSESPASSTVGLPRDMIIPC